VQGDYAAISGDARYVAFVTDRPANPQDTNGVFDVYVRDRQNGVTLPASVANDGSFGDHASSGFPKISRDGHLVVFQSDATNLVPLDLNAQFDIFARDLATGVTEIVSLSSSGAQQSGSAPCSGCVRSCGASFDGRYVFFQSDATNLVVGDSNNAPDLFVRDRSLGTTTLATLVSDGSQLGLGAYGGGISDDGRYILFETYAPNVVIGHAAIGDVFVRDTQLSVAPMLGYCTAKTNSQGCAPSIAATGAPLFSGFDSFFVIAQSELNQKSGIFFWGHQPATIAFGGGTLCVQPPLVRSPVLSSGGSASGADCSGRYAWQFRQSYMAAKGLSAGDTLYGQFWSRDPGFAPPNNVGLTDAIQFTIAP
jgi:hypothetical protein